MTENGISPISDADIIEGLKAGGAKEEKCLYYLYEQNLSSITSMILKNQGSEEDARDIFQDAIVIFYEHVISGKYYHGSKVSTYLYSISKNLWINELKKMGREKLYKSLQTEQSQDLSPLERVMEQEKQGFIYLVMNKLGEDCRAVLNLSIFHKLSMKEISLRMNFQNEQIARNKKYKCMNQLKEIIKNSSSLTELIDEMR